MYIDNSRIDGNRSWEYAINTEYDYVKRKFVHPNRIYFIIKWYKNNYKFNCGSGFSAFWVSILNVDITIGYNRAVMLTDKGYKELTEIGTKL
jgi:hypothetical protein